LKQPQKIKPAEIPCVIADRFKDAGEITCYVSSNAATPTTCIEALSQALAERRPALPYMNMVHILLQGPVPYVREGMQDRVMCYSIFSAGDVREAANRGRAYYLPCSLANIDSLIGEGRRFQPDLVITKVSQNPYTGEYSLGLSVEAMHTAIANAKMIIAELDPSMPFTEGQSVVDAGAIDFLVEEGVKPVYEIPGPDFSRLSPAERRIGQLIAEHFIVDGATLQVGIGKIPDAVVGTIREGNFKDLGINTELYGDGLMLLQQAGIVTNRRKKTNQGYSTTSLIMGSRKLYDYVHMRTAVQMRPCSYTNSAAVVQANAPFISINTAIGVDFFGNVWADFISRDRYYGGVGGQPDFIRALVDKRHGAAIIAMKSLTDKGESKIVRDSPPGVSLTASAYDSVVIVTEWGIADLRELTVSEKALAVASIAHPLHREKLIQYIMDNPMFIKPKGFASHKIPKGVTVYHGPIGLEE